MPKQKPRVKIKGMHLDRSKNSAPVKLGSICMLPNAETVSCGPRVVFLPEAGRRRDVSLSGAEVLEPELGDSAGEGA
jgi:hypothetical protein